MKRMRILSILMMFLMLSAVVMFAATEENVEIANNLTKSFRLNVNNCPTLEQVANNQLTNIQWSNPGGGDKTFCYVRLSGFQKNHDRFEVTFRYDVEAEKLEPYSVRNGAKENFRIDQVQKQLVKFFSTESPEVWQVMKGMK